MALPRVLFASYHCYHDPSSGAALCTRDLFSALAKRGWRCGAFTGPNLDDAETSPIGLRLRDLPGVRSTRGTAGPIGFSLHSTFDPARFPVTVFAPEPQAASRSPSAEEAVAFLATLKDLIPRFRPDIVLTYGGDKASVGVRTLAARAKAKVVFWLHNLGYTTQDAFAGCDAVVAPSRFLCDHYRAKTGVSCSQIPPVIDESRVLAERTVRAKFVTFLNPVLQKGVTVFARLAELLSKTRPDIPFLVVEGRGRIEWLGNCGVDLSNVNSIQKMANTVDPRQFYRLSRIVLVPSFCQESFGRVVVEAMLNGIPVIASDRGALPEVVGTGGICLSLPEQLGPSAREAPSAKELEPWITSLLRLWDDPDEYENAARAAVQASARWHSAVVVPMWEKFLTNLAIPS